MDFISTIMCARWGRVISNLDCNCEHNNNYTEEMLLGRQ